MSDKTKRVDQTKEEEAASAELTDQDLDQAAGGGSNAVKGIDIVVKKKHANDRGCWCRGGCANKRLINANKRLINDGAPVRPTHAERQTRCSLERTQTNHYHLGDCRVYARMHHL
jgi:hypothetical protein